MVFKYLAFLFVKDQKWKVLIDHIFSIVDTFIREHIEFNF
jgi:hypothetical protein